MKGETKLQRLEKRRFWIVHTLYPFKSLTVDGKPCKSPESGMVGFIPVFASKEAAVKHNNGLEVGVSETSEL